MELSDLIRARFSVRKYKDTPVEPEKLAAILEAGHEIYENAGLRQRLRIHRLPFTRAAL